MRAIRAMLWLLAFGFCVAMRGANAIPALDEALAARLAQLALDCVQREYPNKLSHELSGEQDIQAPHALYPAFYGCYDWHSSVHAHWLLARLVRKFPQAAFTTAARAALAHNLTAERIAGEVAYLKRGTDETFERPYGLAWLLQLGVELREWDDPQARQWSAALAPLEDETAQRFARWLPKLTAPIRAGEHSQTAFAFGLVLDWAKTREDVALRELLVHRTREFYLTDRRCPIDYEPSGQDFLSPCLAEADLMRRVLEPAQFSHWLRNFLPQIPHRATSNWLAPGVVRDPSDGKLAHLDGLNLSRAWMLIGIASALPPRDPRRAVLHVAAEQHAQSGLRAVSDAHYAGAHWLGSFAAYLLTGRGA